jgi:OCT family organic cation transporter-like MFS transporter 4/5
MGDGAASVHVDFDDLLEAVGDSGFYQIMVFCLIGLMMFVSIDAFAINFLAATTEHWCDVDSTMFPGLLNMSAVDRRRLTVPPDQSTASGYSRCYRYDMVESLMNRSTFENGSDHADGRPLVRCERWNYDRSVFPSTIVSQWDLVCDRAWLVDLVSTVYMVGRLIACIIYGPISDRFGRKLTVIVFHAVKMVGAVLTIYAPTYELFAAARFLIAVGSTASNLATFLIVSEVCGRKWRSFVGVGWSMMLTIGSTLMPGVAYLFRDYKVFQSVCTWPQFILFIYVFLLDESPRWLVSRGRNKEAMKIMRKIARLNRRHLPEETTLNIQQQPIKPSPTRHRQSNCCNSKCAVASLVATPNLRLKSMIIWLNWFIDALMYYALSLNAGRLPGNIFLNMFLLAGVEIPANLAAAFLLERLGRRPTLGCGTILGAISSLLMIPFMFIPNAEVAVTVFGILGKAFITTAYSSVYVVTSDTYPTSIRAVGMGASTSIGRIGSLGASFVGGVLVSILTTTRHLYMDGVCRLCSYL